jgi:hypothetical protein
MTDDIGESGRVIGRRLGLDRRPPCVDGRATGNQPALSDGSEKLSCGEKRPNGEIACSIGGPLAIFCGFMPI